MTYRCRSISGTLLAHRVCCAKMLWDIAQRRTAADSEVVVATLTPSTSTLKPPVEGESLMRHALKGKKNEWGEGCSKFR